MANILEVTPTLNSHAHFCVYAHSIHSRFKGVGYMAIEGVELETGQVKDFKVYGPKSTLAVL